MSNTVHIVCLDAPSPPDYGGVFDLYYKIPALAATGKNIILHYFDYKKNRGAGGLEKFCSEIHSYKRSSILGSLLRGNPYIVSSRTNKKLIRRLNEDVYPIIIEGIHCSGIIPYLNKNKKIVLRLHNDEAEYYRYLAKAEKNFLKRIYFRREASLLSKYQNTLPKDIECIAVSETDVERFKTLCHFTRISFLPCFLPWQNVTSKTGKGNYCLYHGNLTVSENIGAVQWLIDNVFSGINYSCIIAGKNAKKFAKRIGSLKNIKLVESPSDDELLQLITNAHIHILPSLNNTGVKIKLLHVLFEGRFCITNENGINGSGLHNGISVSNNKEETISLIHQLMQAEFTRDDIETRKHLLHLYNNEINAQKVNELLKHYQ